MRKIGIIEFQKKVGILGIGIIASIMVFLLFYTLFARVLVLTFLEGEAPDFTLLLLIIILLLISFLSSILISLWRVDDLPDRVVVITALVSFIINLFIIAIISYIFLYIMYPEVFSKVQNFEVIYIFPSVLLYFSVYVLGNPIYLFIISIINYYVLFIIFLEYFLKK